MQGSLKRIYERTDHNIQLPLSDGELLHHRTRKIEPKVLFGELLRRPLTVSQQDAGQSRHTEVMTAGIGHREILTVSLLLESCDGHIYDRRRRQFITKITVERGHLLYSAREDNELIWQRFRDEIQNETNRRNVNMRNVLFMKCLEFDNVYLQVPTTKVVLLTDFEASLLKAVQDVEVRFRFHRDSDLFNFVGQLSVGDRVVVQLKPNAGKEGRNFKPGWVEWFGEPVPDKGYLFGVRLDSAVGDMDGFFNGRRLFAAPRNGAVLVSGDRLRNPRNVSILDDDPTFAVYGFSSLPDHYRGDNDDDYYSPLRRRECEAISIPISTPVVRNEGIIVPITRIESNSNSNNSISNGTKVPVPNRPIIRNVPIQIIPAAASAAAATTTAGLGSFGQNQSPRPTYPPPALPTTTGSLSRFPVDETDDAVIMRSNVSENGHCRQSPLQKMDINVNIAPARKHQYDVPYQSSGMPFLKDSSRSFSETRPTKHPVAAETERLKSNNGELLEGDRIVWFDAMGIPRRGTARWIGYLRGHTNVYVGVDFDEPIGGGTGYFEGLELFRCPPNHAGLLPISVVMKEVDMGDEENNVLDVATLTLHPSSSEQPLPNPPQQSPPPSPQPPAIPNHADIIPRNPPPRPPPPLNQHLEPLNDKDENKETPRLAQFTLGSCVEVLHRNERRFGVVKWIANGNDELIQNNRLVAVEIEGDLPNEWKMVDKVQVDDARKAGVFDNASPEAIALVPYCALRSDDRFASPVAPKNIDSSVANTKSVSNFGSLDSGIEVRPCLPTKNIDNLIGRMKGIQGFRNSCYLDTTLYAMFSQCSAFDSILESRCETAADSVHTEVTDILKTEIVYPLRRFHFIRADHVLKLRRLLERLLPEMKGLTTGEKDPEELLNALFNTVLRVEPFLVMRNMTDGKTNPAFICPLITEDLWSEEQRRLISVQSLLERSLFASNIQFAYEPKVLILQLPRYGQQKVFDKIFPPQEVDITHLIDEGKRPCVSCGKLADMMCPECFLTQEVFIGEVTYCGICYERTHNGLDHQPQLLSNNTSRNSFSTSTSSSSSLSLSRRLQVPQKKLHLASVLCIETSHYVAFVRALYATNKWVFFDSMADRVGLSDGYNVPQVKLCEKMSSWLCDAGWLKMRDTLNREGHLPNDVENDPDLMRLLSDCYICFYTNEENNSKNDGLSLSRFFI